MVKILKFPLFLFLDKMSHEVIFDANVVVRNQAILDFKKYWFYTVGILDLVKGCAGGGGGVTHD